MAQLPPFALLLDGGPNRRYHPCQRGFAADAGDCQRADQIARAGPRRKAVSQSGTAPRADRYRQVGFSLRRRNLFSRPGNDGDFERPPGRTAGPVNGRHCRRDAEAGGLSIDRARVAAKRCLPDRVSRRHQRGASSGSGSARYRCCLDGCAGGARNQCQGVSSSIGRMRCTAVCQQAIGRKVSARLPALA